MPAPGRTLTTSHNVIIYLDLEPTHKLNLLTQLNARPFLDANRCDILIVIDVAEVDFEPVSAIFFDCEGNSRGVADYFAGRGERLSGTALEWLTLEEQMGEKRCIVHRLMDSRCPLGVCADQWFGRRDSADRPSGRGCIGNRADLWGERGHHTGLR